MLQAKLLNQFVKGPISKEHTLLFELGIIPKRVTMEQSKEVAVERTYATSELGWKHEGASQR